MLIDNKLSNSTLNRFSIYSVQVDWLQKIMAYHSKYTDRNLLIEKKEIKKKGSHACQGILWSNYKFQNKHSTKWGT